MRVQVVRLQGLRHTEPVEHAANAVDAESPEWSFAVLSHQLLESAHLVGTSRMEAQLASLPACPGVGCHPEQSRRFGLGERAERTSKVDQVQIDVAGAQRTIRHV